MKKFVLKTALCAGALLPALGAAAQPAVSAPEFKALAAEDVLSIYSDDYTPAVAWSFGEWGSGTQYSAEQIAGTADNVAKFVVPTHYFGWDLVADVDASAMTYLHVDFWTDTEGTVNVYPICRTQAQGEKYQTVTLKAGEWVSAVLPLDYYSENGLDLTGVAQLKFAEMGARTIYIDNVYFYKEDTSSDTEAPVWTSEPAVKSFDYKTAVIAATATDNISTMLTYEASFMGDFDEVAASATAAAGAEAQLSLTGLTASTAYTCYVRVKDAAGNVADEKTVQFTTADAPVLERVTYYGTAGGPDEANWIDKAGYFPTIDYTMTTTEENQLEFTAKLSEVSSTLGSVELWCDQLPAPGYVTMTRVEGTDEWTATLFAANEKERGDQINFRFRFPISGGAPMTQNIFLKVGDSNEPPTTDTEAPVWAGDVTVGDVTDKEAVLTLALTDNSGSVNVTVEGDNFAAVTKRVAADGTQQQITIDGLTPETAYTLRLTAADAAGNAAEGVKTVNFTTKAAVALETLYVRLPFTADDWDSPTDVKYQPSGDVLITILPDNRLKFEFTLSETRDDFAVTNLYVHGFEENVSLVKSATADNVYEYTTTKSIDDRSALVNFHAYFVYPGGTSTFAVKNFKPSEGNTSGVASTVATGAKVYAANGAVRVSGAAGKTVAVYSVSGQLVYRAVASDDMAVSLPAGVYVVTVDGQAVKVAL